jgi:hypothetical protein
VTAAIARTTARAIVLVRKPERCLPARVHRAIRPRIAIRG